MSVWAALAIASAERREAAGRRGLSLDFDGSILALRKFTSRANSLMPASTSAWSLSASATVNRSWSSTTPSRAGLQTERPLTISVALFTNRPRECPYTSRTGLMPFLDPRQPHPTIDGAGRPATAAEHSDGRSVGPVKDGQRVTSARGSVGRNGTDIVDGLTEHRPADVPALPDLPVAQLLDLQDELLADIRRLDEKLAFARRVVGEQDFTDTRRWDFPLGQLTGYREMLHRIQAVILVHRAEARGQFDVQAALPPPATPAGGDPTP